MKDKKESIEINKLVGILESGEILYIHRLHWNGVSTNLFDHLTQEGVDYRCDIDFLKDTYDYLWQEDVANGETELGLEDYLQELVSNCSYNGTWFPGQDNSYTHLITHEDIDLLEEHLQIDIECFECVGGGNSSLKDYKFAKIFNQEVLDQALKHEATIKAQQSKPPKLLIV